MKIKILSESFCVAEYQDGNFAVGSCTIEDCSLDRNLKAQLQQNGLPCLTKQVDEQEKFFFGISLSLNGTPVQTSYYVGHLECVDGEITIVPEEQVWGDRLRLTNGDHVLLFAHRPTDLSFLDHHCSVMTSDALLALEPDTYIGYKDGHIDILSADELLDQLSRHEVERSPSFEELSFKPVYSRPSRPLTGTLIYNTISKALELFDGTSWRTIQSKE